MDNNYCSVPQCTSHGCHLPRPSFHRFPSANEKNYIVRNRRLQWITKLRIGKEVTSRMVVCGKHFKPFDFFPTPLANSNNGKTKRLRLKRNAVPSLNLPKPLEDTVNSKDKDSKKSNAKKQNKKAPPVKKKTPEKRTFSSQETSKNESIRYQEEENNKTSSDFIAVKNKETMDTSPPVTQLRIIVPNYSAIDADTIEHASKNVEKCIQNSTVSVLPVQMNENSKLDYSIFKSSPNDSKEVLSKKLDTMVSVNELLHKKVSFFQNKCEMYEKEVNIMKGVLENLKQLNSATFDN